MNKETLEKNIPREVTIMKYGYDYDFTCTRCNTTFKYIKYTDRKFNYCPECGQLLSWKLF